MIFVDTGAFLGRYLANDQYFAQARQFWEQLRHPIVTSNLVLVEFATLLTRRVSGGFAAERLRRIYDEPDCRILRPGEAEEREALALVDKFADHRLGMTDAVSMILMRRHKLRRIFTFRNYAFDAKADSMGEWLTLCPLGADGPSGIS